MPAVADPDAGGLRGEERVVRDAGGLRGEERVVRDAGGLRGEERVVRPQWPLLGLLAMSTAVFLSVTTELLPTGLLPSMSRDLGRDRGPARPHRDRLRRDGGAVRHPGRAGPGPGPPPAGAGRGPDRLRRVQPHHRDQPLVPADPGRAAARWADPRRVLGHARRLCRPHRRPRTDRPGGHDHLGRRYRGGVARGAGRDRPGYRVRLAGRVRNLRRGRAGAGRDLPAPAARRTGPAGRRPDRVVRPGPAAAALPSS